MQITDLPVEILIVIIQKLDVKSLYSLYNTCKLYRNVVCLQGVIKKCDLSGNTMATANTLKLNFFKNISNHLFELNVSGVPDLCKTKFIPALKKLKNLRILDISHTNFIIPDITEIHEVCPTIKDIAINFVFKSQTVANNMLLQCQSTFKDFENVTFIGSLGNLLWSKVALYLLEKAKLHKLNFVVTECRFGIFNCDNDLEHITLPEFDKFSIYIMNWIVDTIIPIPYVEWRHCLVLSMLQLRDYEYIVILMYDFTPNVYASPMFDNFFKDHFDLSLECSPLDELEFMGNLAVMVWNKTTTTFDEKFFKSLKSRLKQYFPWIFQLQDDLPDCRKYKWFYTAPIPDVYKKSDNVMHENKKRRVAAPNFVLDYDVIFQEEQKVELTLDFKHPIHNAIALNAKCEYLRKLTYLSLDGCVRYSPNFFNILFRCCVNLVTLNVQCRSVAPCASAVSHSLPLSCSLKNLRLVDRRMEFKSLFASFSQCPTLENIHIVDKISKTACNEYAALADPRLFIKTCKQLYSIHIEVPISQGMRTRAMQLFNKAKSSYKRPHIRVVLYASNDLKEYNHDPFLDVFKLNPIKPLD